LHLGNILIKYKPGTNIFDTCEGSLKIIDVGNAKLISSSNADMHVMSNIGGTQRYFSPERITSNTFNEKDDIWAVSAMLTELVTGRWIHNRDTAGNNGVFFATDRCESLRREVVEEVKRKSPRLGDIVAYMMVVNTGDRPSAKQILSQMFPR
jgi:serine/threonine protein kinase